MRELINIINETDARSWDSLAGLRGDADVCTCSDAQLTHVGCDCGAQQNLPIRCKGVHCDQFLRTSQQIASGFCSERCESLRETVSRTLMDVLEEAGDSLDWCPPGDRRDYKRLAREVGGEQAREAIEDRIRRREALAAKGSRQELGHRMNDEIQYTVIGKRKNGSFRSALRAYGFSAKEIAQVIDALDSDKDATITQGVDGRYKHHLRPL